jgi:hypothetical protein
MGNKKRTARERTVTSPLQADGRGGPEELRGAQRACGARVDVHWGAGGRVG